MSPGSGSAVAPLITGRDRDVLRRYWAKKPSWSADDGLDFFDGDVVGGFEYGVG